MEIHHIGYLVKDLESAVKEFQKLGYSIEINGCEGTEDGVTHDQIRKVDIVFMINGSYRVELVQPVSKESSVYGLLKRYSNSPYHICYCSEDLEKDIETLRNNGWTLFQKPEIAPAISNRRVAFLLNASIGMIELVAEN